MSDYKPLPNIKKNISLLKNKIFSIFKIKKNKKNIDSSELSKIKESVKEPVNDNIDCHVESMKNKNSQNTEDNSKILKSVELEDDGVEALEESEESEESEEDEMIKINSSFLLNRIIDNIVTSTFGSCDNKTYVKNISDFYINNEDYDLYKTIFSPLVYAEFIKYVNGILTKNNAILYNLRSVKIYDDDMAFCSCRAGVFKTDNFIIKIDTDSFNFKNEISCMYNIGKGLIKEHNIVLPYYARITCKNKKAVNFSIQPRIHNTISLRDWLQVYKNQQLNIETYINICIQICKSIQFIHSKHIVHGDIKPDNILIETNTNTPYVIDFGLSGLHGLSEGTGGTKPFCHPKTMNTDDNISITEYNWQRNEKKNDVWSISFIFANVIIFRKCYSYYGDFPVDFFDDDRYVSINYLNYIPKQYRNAFIFTLAKSNNVSSNTHAYQNTTLDIQNFILLLEKGLKL